MAKPTVTFKLEKENLDDIKNEIDDEDITQSQWLRDAVTKKLNNEYESIEELRDRLESLETELSKIKTAIIESAVYDDVPGERLDDTERVIDVGEGGITTGPSKSSEEREG